MLSSWRHPMPVAVPRQHDCHPRAAPAVNRVCERLQSQGHPAVSSRQFHGGVSAGRGAELEVGLFCEHPDAL